ncbi:MAG: hypothetical protein Q9227_003533 [Pyrenula ochraceoflavens]
MSKPFTDAESKLMFAVIRRTTEKLDWKALATELGLPTSAAANKRYTRLIQANKDDDLRVGDGSIMASPPKTPSKRGNGDEADGSRPKKQSRTPKKGTKETNTATEDEDTVKKKKTMPSGTHEETPIKAENAEE